MVPAARWPCIGGSAERGVSRAHLRPNWLLAVRRYLAASAAGNIVWEVAQIPLYTLWRKGSPEEITWAILHCSAGDVLIASTALMGALAVLGSSDWPRKHCWRVAAAVILIGLGYTVISERLHLARDAWAYSDQMPVLPWLDIGLAPFAQWLAIPALCLAVACRALRHRPIDDVDRVGRGRSPG